MTLLMIRTLISVPIVKSVTDLAHFFARNLPHVALPGLQATAARRLRRRKGPPRAIKPLLLARQPSYKDVLGVCAKMACPFVTAPKEAHTESASCFLGGNAPSRHPSKRSATRNPLFARLFSASMYPLVARRRAALSSIT